jgi:aryl carrier-like protein
LAAVLPEYMVPAAYVVLDALPLTPNGKLDRRALPAPQAEAFGSAAFEPPLPGMEQTLAELWSELLGLPRIGRHDNFFELGGHSLLAIGLIERMRRLGWVLEVRALFASPTLATQAQALRLISSLDAVPPPANPLAIDLDINDTEIVL